VSSQSDTVSRRRRGAVLEAAIYRAVREELTEVGYSAASLDGIARRARIGRMSLYRRWNGKAELVLDAMRDAIPRQTDAPRGAALAEQLRTILEAMFVVPEGLPVLVLHLVASQTAELRTTPLGEAMRREVFAPRLAILETVFAEAQERGEVATDANIPLLARTGPAVLFQQILLTGEQPSALDVATVISQILLPSSAPVTRPPPPTAPTDSPNP